MSVGSTLLRTVRSIRPMAARHDKDSGEGDAAPTELRRRDAVTRSRSTPGVVPAACPAFGLVDPVDPEVHDRPDPEQLLATRVAEMVRCLARDDPVHQASAALAQAGRTAPASRAELRAPPPGRPLPAAAGARPSPGPSVPRCSRIVVARSSLSSRCFESDRQRVAVHFRSLCPGVDQDSRQDQAAPPRADVEDQLVARPRQPDLVA